MSRSSTTAKRVVDGHEAYRTLVNKVIRWQHTVSGFPRFPGYTGAFYWQREFEKLGHKVKVISPQYVRPFVRGQKK